VQGKLQRAVNNNSHETGFLSLIYSAPPEIPKEKSTEGKEHSYRDYFKIRNAENFPG
jgi:hypothetical protein